MKNVYVILMVVGSMLLAACSSNSPTGVVEKAFNAMMAGDFDTYARCFYVEDKSDPERVEKDIQDLVKLMERNSENESEDEKVQEYEILNEEASNTGKWVCVSYKLKYKNGKETEADFYVTKDSDGSWKIQMFGTDRLMEE